jgi:hypothetical protein
VEANEEARHVGVSASEKKTSVQEGLPGEVCLPGLPSSAGPEICLTIPALILTVLESILTEPEISLAGPIFKPGRSAQTKPFRLVINLHCKSTLKRCQDGFEHWKDLFELCQDPLGHVKPPLCLL